MRYTVLLGFLVLTACGSNNQPHGTQSIITDANTVTNVEKLYQCDLDQVNNAKTYAIGYAVQDAWQQCFTCLDSIKSEFTLEPASCSLQYTYTGYPASQCGDHPNAIYINMPLDSSCFK